MTEWKRVKLGEVFARKEREIQEHEASPEGQTARKERKERDAERSAEDAQCRSLQQEGKDAAISGLAVTECPYPEDTRESRLWVYGFENAPSDEDEDEDHE